MQLSQGKIECCRGKPLTPSNESMLVTPRSGARGGLEGAIVPPSEHTSPRRKVKSEFFGDFWHYSTLKTIFYPLIARVSPPLENSWCHPWLHPSLQKCIVLLLLPCEMANFHGWGVTHPPYSPKLRPGFHQCPVCQIGNIRRAICIPKSLLPSQG